MNLSCSRVLYGDILCPGKTGECKGEVTWVGADGQVKGISGTTAFVVGIYMEVQNDGEVGGSAHWPTLTYILPYKFTLRDFGMQALCKIRLLARITDYIHQSLDHGALKHHNHHQRRPVK